MLVVVVVEVVGAGASIPAWSRASWKISARSSVLSGTLPLTVIAHVMPSGRCTTMAWVFSIVPVWPQEPLAYTIVASPYHCSFGCR